MKSIEGMTRAYPAQNTDAIHRAYQDALGRDDHKVVVLDDDPTGSQTVHGVSVYTNWEKETILQGFQEPGRLFFILTNSRSFSAQKTQREHRAIAEAIVEAAKATGKRPFVISRSDSTLRGHYPLEGEAMRQVFEESGTAVDGEIIMPFFPEGGRFTIEGVHYVQTDSQAVPVADTEFARDKTFGFHSSHLAQWVEEKTGGAWKAASVLPLTLGMLRGQAAEGLAQQLAGLSGFAKVVVDAANYADVEVFTTALLQAMAMGKTYMARTAAAFVRVMGGVEPKPLLSAAEILEGGPRANGGLVVVGSHVKRTSHQLEKLLAVPQTQGVAFNQHLVLNEREFEAEIARCTQACARGIQSGTTCVVYTRRERLDLGTSAEEELRLATRISDGLTRVVSGLPIRPAFLIAKGGITSSDVGTKGLGVKRAVVLGQALPGVPVWKTGDESRFPGMPYIIFPGNVGAEDDLMMLVKALLP